MPRHEDPNQSIFNKSLEFNYENSVLVVFLIQIICQTPYL